MYVLCLYYFLKDGAVTYIHSKPKSVRSDYRTLQDALDQRYGVVELSSTARRQFSTIRQDELEPLDDLLTVFS